MASPATNKLMVWTVEALELLEIYEFVTNGSIELKKLKMVPKNGLNVEVTTSNELNISSYNHLDEVGGEIKLQKDCLNGLSTEAIKHQRMTFPKSNTRDDLQKISEEHPTLNIKELMAKFTCRPRPPKGERSIPYYKLEFFEFIMVDVIFFVELDSTGSNKGYTTRGEHTEMLVAIDWLSRSSWVRPFYGIAQIDISGN